MRDTRTSLVSPWPSLKLSKKSGVKRHGSKGGGVGLSFSATLAKEVVSSELSDCLVVYIWKMLSFHQERTLDVIPEY